MLSALAKTSRGRLLILAFHAMCHLAALIGLISAAVRVAFGASPSDTIADATIAILLLYVALGFLRAVVPNAAETMQLLRLATYVNSVTVACLVVLMFALFPFVFGSSAGRVFLGVILGAAAWALLLGAHFLYARDMPIQINQQNGSVFIIAATFGLFEFLVVRMIAPTGAGPWATAAELVAIALLIAIAGFGALLYSGWLGVLSPADDDDGLGAPDPTPRLIAMQRRPEIAYAAQVGLH